MGKRVALVTGGSRGLGRVMAGALVKAGHDVVLSAEDRQALEETAAALASGPGRVATIQADLSDPRNAERLGEQAAKAFGQVDVLISNAGINVAGVADEKTRREFWRFDRQLVERLFTINTVAGIVLANALVPAMAERRWGRIVTITTSLDTMLRFPLYGASKAAVEAQTAFMATSLQGTGVTANVLVPGGAAATRMADIVGMKGMKLIPAEVMAAPAAFLASDEADDFNARRIIAVRWKEELPPAEAAQAASDPIAWSGLGAQAVVLR